LDYELGSPLRVRILARNENGDTVETPFEVEVEDVFEPEQPTYSVGSAASLEMIWVEPGTFTMGQEGVAEPVHHVTLTRGFYLGKYEVTQAEYEAVMAGNTEGYQATPSLFSGSSRLPVERLEYGAILKFIEILNEKEAGNLPPGWEYVLPTEAEWEYACRAGTSTAYSWGDEIDPSWANYDSSGFSQTVEVGQYAPNPWGFFDMHGNVFEWTADWYADYEVGDQVDPTGPVDGENRVNRGGSWFLNASTLQSAYRNQNL